MKKLTKLFCLFSLMLSLGTSQMLSVQAESLTELAVAAGYDVSETDAPEASIVVDADTGQILWAENENEVHDPASLTKIMVAYLTFKAVEEEKVAFDTIVEATDTDQEIASIYALSNNNIISGVGYTINELLVMSMVASSNSATLMLTHAIFDGTDAEFLAYMNETAKELGMENTKFVTATGASAESYESLYAPEGIDLEATDESTAKDQAILTQRLLKEYPEVLAYTNQPTFTVKVGTEYEEVFDTHVHSIPGSTVGIDGVNGLKTGSSPSAGYNVVTTVSRDGKNLIVVALGASDWDNAEGEVIRDEFVNGLIEHVYEQYQPETILEAGVQKVDGTKVEVEEPITVMKKADDEDAQVTYDKDKKSVIISTGLGYLTGTSAVAVTKKWFDFNLYTIGILLLILIILFLLLRWLVTFLRKKKANKDDNDKSGKTAVLATDGSSVDEEETDFEEEPVEAEEVLEEDEASAPVVAEPVVEENDVEEVVPSETDEVSDEIAEAEPTVEEVAQPIKPKKKSFFKSLFFVDDHEAHTEDASLVETPVEEGAKAEFVSKPQSEAEVEPEQFEVAEESEDFEAVEEPEITEEFVESEPEEEESGQVEDPKPFVATEDKEEIDSPVQNEENAQDDSTNPDVKEKGNSLIVGLATSLVLIFASVIGGITVFNKGLKFNFWTISMIFLTAIILVALFNLILTFYLMKQKKKAVQVNAVAEETSQEATEEVEEAEEAEEAVEIEVIEDVPTDEIVDEVEVLKPTKASKSKKKKRNKKKKSKRK